MCEFNWEFKSLCPDHEVVCAGGETEGGQSYGEYEDLAAQLRIVAENRDTIHPLCPSGCRALKEAESDYFLKLDPTFDTTRICIWNDEYHYIEDDGSYTFTCVGYGAEVDVCLTHKMLCVGFEEYTGLPTYGHPGAQARAVITAAGELDHCHPQCPGLP